MQTVKTLGQYSEKRSIQKSKVFILFLTLGTRRKNNLIVAFAKILFVSAYEGKSAFRETVFWEMFCGFSVYLWLFDDFVYFLGVQTTLLIFFYY